MIFVPYDGYKLLNSSYKDKIFCAPQESSSSMFSVVPREYEYEAEIKKALSDNKIPYYSEFAEISVIDESRNDAADESYKGIFIDRDTGEFKILSGRFPDKKSMINKYGVKGKGYITRKVFEKPVFDWILKNAKNTLDSYLMFSTALSKWKDNAMLDKYYIKIMNDMPELFKNTRKNSEIDESSLEEDYQFGAIGKEHGHIAVVLIKDEDGNVIDKSDVPVKYRSDDKNILNSPELFEEMQWFVKEYPEAAGVYVKLDKSPDEYFIDKKSVLSGVVPEIQSNTNWNHDRAMFIKDPEKTELKGYMYVRDAQGNPVEGALNSKRLVRNVDKDKGINDFEVWAAATGILEEFPEAEFIYMNIPALSEKDFVLNRSAVYKNFQNSYNNKVDPKIIPWKKSNPERKFKVHKARGGDKNYVKQYQSAEEFARDRQAQQRESKTMSIREQIRAIVEASGIYDLPVDDIDLSDKINHTIKLFVKSLIGKNDVETVTIEKNVGEDVELEDLNSPEVEAAARRLKDRNIGKKIFWQVDNEPAQEYISIEE